MQQHQQQERVGLAAGQNMLQACIQSKDTLCGPYRSWYPCDARPRISGMILLELPILGPVDLSSL